VDPLSLTTFAALFGSAAWFRRVGFSLVCVDTPNPVSPGLGRHIALETAYPAAYPAAADPGTTTIIVPDRCLSESACREWITRAVASLEGEGAGAA
jgi:hypothetical protein